ncbi:hypothetical protein CH373_01270 [Leptospira perolatii]|uniref:Uncharacterized protein n=1 Tax=Leptospira perolatii TaxID=2023191 RepID=A0A2M9ZRW2_9LEPT|nr:DUF6580 family putative transport protein [Leptospira perolatii]PJZ71176.1 hypothetical protein CH360_01270 [Leptospira perolatii]PJZ74709.1 hypothetical protein CH373_01270 [Leptospira perolatii]
MNRIERAFKNLGTTLSLRNWEPLHWIGTLGSCAARFLPHPPNFTPVGAMSIYAGARIKGWNAYLVPILTMLISDRVLAWIHGFDWFHNTLPVVYASLLLNVFLGKTYLSDNSSKLRVVSVSFVGSIQFFLTTNFAVWALSSMYPYTSEGLITCYVAAIPFFQWTLVGDLVYASILFGIFDTLEIRLARYYSQPVSWF